MASPEIELKSEPKQTTSWWKLLLAVLLGLGLLWLAFKDCNFEELKSYLNNLNLFWIIVCFVVGVISHLVRAVRWIWLLKPIADRKVSLWNSFYAVIVGYAVNVAIPRGGEVAGLVAISKMEKLPWAAVLPTMFIDRILDLFALVVLIGISLTLLPKEYLNSMPWLIPGGVVMLIASTIALVLLPKADAIISWFANKEWVKKILPATLIEKLIELSSQFDKGTKSLVDPIGYPVIGFFTAFMWFLYGLNFYLMLLAFNIADKVGFKNTLISLTIGSAGNLIPTPGSSGSFHLLVKGALVETSHLNENLALAYATILHLVTFVIVPCIPAAICLAINGYLSSKDSKQNS